MTVTAEQSRKQQPIQQVQATWIEQGAWCAFSEQHTATCRSERTASNEPIRLARSTEYEPVRAAALEHYQANPTHRVVVESLTQTVFTQPVEETP